MAFEYGFFWDSNNGDRKYNAASFEHWLKKFFTSGVFTGDLQVTANGNMSVNVSSGYANVNGKVRFFENDTTLTIGTADSSLKRIDAVVIERDDIERRIELKVVQGTPATTPEAPSPKRDGVYQLVLAHINIPAGAVNLSKNSIRDVREDTELCGIVTGTVKEIDVEHLRRQFDAICEHYTEEFEKWFENAKDQLTKDAAGNLLIQIEELKSTQHRKNLLINSNFGNPVNQRGEITKTSQGYWIDRWKKDGITTATIKEGHIELSAGAGSAELSMHQYLECAKEILGKKITFSVKEYGGDVVSLTTDIPKKFPNATEVIAKKATEKIVLKIEMTSAEKTRVIIGVPSNKSVSLEWAKLELGSSLTNYAARTYSEEFLMCQRFYQKRYVKDAKLLRVAEDHLRFGVSISPKMRTTPTVDASNVVVLKNNSDSGKGFTVSAGGADEGMVELTCVVYQNGARVNHGLSFSDVISIGQEIYLDAEL